MRSMFGQTRLSITDAATLSVLPMATASGVGAIIGGYLTGWAPTDALRMVLAAILAISAVKLWANGHS